MFKAEAIIDDTKVTLVGKSKGQIHRLLITMGLVDVEIIGI